MKQDSSKISSFYIFIFFNVYTLFSASADQALQNMLSSAGFDSSLSLVILAFSSKSSSSTMTEFPFEHNCSQKKIKLCSAVARIQLLGTFTY